MVVTPWGNSGSLRERKLRPVRGAPPSEVERNQRERLFAAIVACVAERGFAATSVEDLVELSGVSRRSFYDYFGDKAECLREALEVVLGLALQGLENASGESLEEISLRRYLVLAEFAVSQPAASKVILNDVFGAGPEAVESVMKALHEYEKLIRKSFEASPDHAGIPPGLITARLGGVVEISRARLRAGKAADLPGLGDDIVALMTADRPPPRPLKTPKRLPRSKPESLDAADHSERALRAFAKLASERGYANVNIDDVVRLASMSTTTLYANFSGKDDLMAAAIDGACGEALATVLSAFNRHQSWPDAVRAGFGALLAFLASRPELARLVTVEVYAAGDAAIERRASAIAPLGALLENNTTMWGTMPPVVFEVIAGGVAHLLYETVSRSGPEALPGLAPLCTYLTLSPFLGPEEAWRAADGDGEGRTGAIGFAEPMRPGPWIAIGLTSAGPSTVAEIAAAVGEDEAKVSGYVRQMEAMGMLKEVGERNGERTYEGPGPSHPLSIISERQMAAMDVDERKMLMGNIWRLIRADIELADEQGRLAERPDIFLTRTPMSVDAQGWREMNRVHEEALAAGLEIGERSRKRLERSGEPGFEARSMQAFFELPKEPETEQPG